MQDGYRIAGVIQRTVRELVSVLSSQCPRSSPKAVWDRWLPHILMKSLYMLWVHKLVGLAPLDSRYHLATKQMAEFLLAPKWRAWGFPDMRGVMGAGTIKKKAPVTELASTCVAVSTRVERNRKAMMLDLGEEEEDSDDDPDEFFDDTENDDISDVDEDDLDGDDLAEWSGEE